MVSVRFHPTVNDDTKWPKDQHVATSWSIGYMTGKRVGTKYWYLHNWRDGIDDKGFMWRPKFLEFQTAERDNG